MPKIIKSKYGFSTLKMGDWFVIKPIEIGSMRSSLSRYNKSNGTDIKVSVNELSDTEVRIQRI